MTHGGYWQIKKHKIIYTFSKKEGTLFFAYSKLFTYICNNLAHAHEQHKFTREKRKKLLITNLLT